MPGLVLADGNTEISEAVLTQNLMGDRQGSSYREERQALGQVQEGASEQGLAFKEGFLVQRRLELSCTA